MARKFRRAASAEAGVVDFRLDTSTLRRLPSLHGQEWSSLPRAIREARRLAQDLYLIKTHPGLRGAELVKGRVKPSP